MVSAGHNSRMLRILRKSGLRVKMVHLAIIGGLFLVLAHLYFPEKTLLVPGSIEREKEREKKLVAEGRTCCHHGSHIPGEYVKGDDVLKIIDLVSIASATLYLIFWGAFMKMKSKKLH